MQTGTDLLPLAVALLIGIPAFGSCIGIGLATMKFLEGVTRQPEMATELQTKYFSGRAKASAELLVALADVLDMPLRERNALLLAELTVELFDPADNSTEAALRSMA